MAGPDFQSREARRAWALDRMCQDYNQREILAFGIEILMSGNEDTPELAPEGIGLEMVWLKTVIDALDR